MLILKDICFKRDNKQILDNINIEIDTNKFIAITGPNGSGKSTLVKVIMGIVKPDSGQVIFNGKDITNLPINERAKLGISFGFQKPVEFKGLTVFDLIKLSDGNDITKKQAHHILTKVGLCPAEYLDREINNNLSGGEIKRIEIATIIARQSKLFIFDEPEAGIDLWSFNYLIDIFKTISNFENTSTLVISHQERILNIADKVILIKNGKVNKMDIKGVDYTNSKCLKCIAGDKCE